MQPGEVCPRARQWRTEFRRCAPGKNHRRTPGGGSVKTLLRSGFRQKAGNFRFLKCGGLPTAATLAILLFVGNLFAADIASDFSAANRFYAQGKFPEAAKAYETILQSGAQSPALLFNYGNAEFKSGHLGK